MGGRGGRKTKANAEGRIQGQFDSPLSEQGREQSRALAQRLVGEGWRLSGGR